MRRLGHLFLKLRQLLAPAPVSLAHPDRPPMPALRMSAVEILRNEPNLSAAELAERAGVTRSYASMLVRRRRPRPIAVAAVRTLSSRTSAYELSARTQILQAASAGTSVPQIAQQFGLVAGEVEFAIKVARLAKKS